MILGHGIAKHHFWGDYKATIIVAFKAQHLLSPHTVSVALPSFDVTVDEEANSVVARFFGGDKALDAAIAELVAVGATKKKILSLARSIDWGEEFTVDVAPAPKEVQQPLFNEQEANK